MELQIGTDEFSRALYRAQGIVEKKSTMPILGSVLMEATEDQKLRVTAFDLEIGVQTTHPAEIRKPGAVAIHANRYTDVVAGICAVHLYETRGTHPQEALEAAEEAGLVVTEESERIAWL